MSERITIKLKKPITLSGKDGAAAVVVDELHFREPKAKDLRGITLIVGDSGLVLNCDDLLKLAGRCSGQPDNVIGELGFSDMREVGAAILDFIGVSLPTGQS